jgi:hypothetical protein
VVQIIIANSNILVKINIAEDLELSGFKSSQWMKETKGKPTQKTAK